MTPDVELATSADLAKLPQTTRGRKPKPERAGHRKHPECPPGKRCSECQSNRKWERIFAEKFEDPTYYVEGAASHDRSALHDVI
jgi:hypothetical protein